MISVTAMKRLSPLCLAALMAVVAVVVLQKSLASCEREMTGAFQRSQLIAVRSIAGAVEEIFKEVEDNLLSLAAHVNIHDHPDDAQLRLDGHYKSRDDVLLAMTVTDADGNFILRSPRTTKTKTTKNISHWPEFAAVRDAGKPFVGEPQLSVFHTDQVVMRVCVPLEEEDGRFAGMLYGSISLDKLWGKCLSRPLIGQDSVCWVVDSNGRMLYHPRADFRHRRWEEIVEEFHAAHGFGNEAQEEHQRETRLKIQMGEEGKAHYCEHHVGGVSQMIAFTPIDLGTARYGLAVVSPKSEIAGPIADHRRLSYHLMTVITVFFSVVGYLTYRGRIARLCLTEERKFRSLFEQSNDAIFIHDRKGKILEVNNRACQMLGYGPDQLPGKNISLFHLQEDMDKIADRHRRAAREGSVRFEDRFLRADGTTVEVEVSAAVIDAAAGTILESVVRDITDQKQREEEKEQLLHDLAERVKELECLYGATRSAREREKLEEVFQGVAALIPAGWHYPEITRCRIVFDGAEYLSEPFEKTEWKQSSDIVVGGACRGAVEVYYLRQCPELDEGPFMREERNLIDDLARTLGETVARKQAEQELQQRMDELGQFNRLAVGREERMIELKREVNEMSRKAGVAPPYDLAFAESGQGVTGHEA